MVMGRAPCLVAIDIINVLRVAVKAQATRFASVFRVTPAAICVESSSQCDGGFQRRSGRSITSVLDAVAIATKINGMSRTKHRSLWSRLGNGHNAAANTYASGFSGAFVSTGRPSAQFRPRVVQAILLGEEPLAQFGLRRARALQLRFEHGCGRPSRHHAPLDEIPGIERCQKCVP